MKIAFVITGLLQKVDESIKFLNFLSENYDLFICTTKEHEKYLGMFNDVKDYFLVEDDIEENTTQKFLLNLKEGFKILQWQKLFIAKNMIIKYEEVNDIKYDLIYKIRTDLVFRDNLNFNFDRHLNSSKTLFMNSDYYFGGCSEVMKKVCDFYIFILKNYYNRNNIYQPFNFELIKTSDLAAAKFEWLKYPKQIVSKKATFKDFYKVLKKGIIFSNQSESEPFIVFRDNHENIIFPSEPAFLHYVLSLGLNVQKIEDELLNLHPDRDSINNKHRKVKKLVTKIKNIIKKIIFRLKSNFL